MSKHRALRNFFEDALSPSELRRLVWDLLGRRALNALPGPDAPPINITDAAVDLLLRRGAIDKALFDLLQTQFPQRANELEHLRTRWLSASPPTNLPAEEFTLRGRAVEFIRLRQVLLSGSRRHAVILGGPGIGKTALALHLAHAPSITDHYDKQYFVRCDKVKSAVACAELVASVLGVSQVTTTPTNDTPQTLLILDNFDTPWEQDQEEAEHLLAQLTANKTLSVVVTMRGASAPGGMPRGHIVRLGPLCVADARKLFLSIVPAHDSWPNLNRLLARVGGVPHAIVLLARASEGNVLELIERDYQHRGTLLLERLGSKPVKSASWSSSINTSLQSCRMTKGAQRLAAVLARIPDGVASEDIEVVTTEPQDVTTLIQVGLAHFKTGRLQMLQPVREHIAQEHELRVGDMSEVMEHYGKLARSLGPKIGQTGGAAALKRLAPERGNLEAALQHAFSCETTDVLRWVKTSYALQNFARFSMHDVQSSFLAAALLSRRNGLRKYELRCLMAAGLNALSCSQFGAAHTHYTSAFARARDLGSTFDQARCISRLGDVSLGQSLLLEARIRYERAHTIHKQAALQVSPAHSLRGLGYVAFHQRRPKQARSCFESAWRHFYPWGGFGLAACHMGLGGLALHEGQRQQSVQSYRAAFDIFQAIGAVQSSAKTLEGLGRTAISGRDFEEASYWYRRALSLHLEVRTKGRYRCLNVLRKLAKARGQHGEARFYLEALLHQRRTHRSPAMV